MTVPRVPGVLLAAVLALVAGCGRTSAVRPATGPLIYVSDETGGRVVTIDANTAKVVHAMNVGKRPRGIALSPDGARLYVALSGSPIGGPGVDESKLPPADRSADGIGVIDVATGTLVRKYLSGPDPETFAVSPDGKRIYVSNEDAAAMSVLDLDSGKVTAQVKVGDEPEGITVSPDHRTIYVSCEASSKVVAIDAASLQVVATYKTPGRPRSTVFLPDGSAGFAMDETGGVVVVLDPPKQSVDTVIEMPRDPGAQIPPRPMGAVLSHDSKDLFVTLGRAKSIADINTDSRKVVRMIKDVGDRPWGIGISADGGTLYTANGPSGDVSFVDVASGRTARRVAVGGSPWGVAVAHAR